MNMVINFNRKALKEFEYIDIEEWNQIYDGLGTNLNKFFIRGLKLNIRGFEAKNAQMIRDSEGLFYLWNVWVANNKEALQKAWGN